MTIGLWASMLPRPGAVASYALRVPRAGGLPAASFGPRLAAAALAVRLTVPAIRVRRGLPPPSECALPGAHEKKARHSPGRGNAGPYVRFPTAIPLSGKDQDLHPSVFEPSLLCFIIRNGFGFPQPHALDLVAVRRTVVQEVFLHRRGSSLGKG